MDTNQDKGKELLGVTLTNTEAHGVICAALFSTYDRTEHGVDDDILMDLCYGDRETAIRRAIIRLANHKIVMNNMDMGQIKYDGDDNPNRYAECDGDDELPVSSDNPIGYAMDDDLFGGPRTTEDRWDGDETDKIQY